MSNLRLEFGTFDPFYVLCPLQVFHTCISTLSNDITNNAIGFESIFPKQFVARKKKLFNVQVFFGYLLIANHVWLEIQSGLCWSLSITSFFVSLPEKRKIHSSLVLRCSAILIFLAKSVEKTIFSCEVQ